MAKRGIIFLFILVLLFSLSLNSIHATKPGTCSNPSGGNYCNDKSNSECYCDAACGAYGDCCQDYEEICSKPNPTVSKTSPLPIPPALTGAGNLVCGQLRLDYIDNSINEDGFRIWRKAGSSSAPYNSNNGWTDISGSTQGAWPGTGTQRPYVDPTYNGPAGANPPTGKTTYYYVIEVYNSAGSSYTKEVNGTNVPCETSADDLIKDEIWKRYSGNPILVKSKIPSWDDLVVYAPKILKNSDGSPYVDSQGNYYLFYTASGTLLGRDYDQTGLALSKNLFNWTRYGSNPVLPLGPVGSVDYGDADAETVLKDGNIFHMWYGGNSNRGGTDDNTINYATSTDGKNWSKYGSNPILKQGSGDDNFDLYSPIVIKDGSVWKMWYTGHNSNEKFAVMYATAPQPQGPWTKYSNKFVFNPTDYTWPMEVWKEKGKYYMTYGIYSSEHHFDQIYLASSEDGIGWTKKGAVFTAAGGDGWDGWQVRGPNQIKAGNVWYTFYDGSDPETYSIGVATSSARVSSVFLPILCGNNICEEGENDYCPSCPGPLACPAVCKIGTCQQDCTKNLEIISPNGGENWFIGDSNVIKWNIPQSLIKDNVNYGLIVILTEGPIAGKIWVTKFNKKFPVDNELQIKLKMVTKPTGEKIDVVPGQYKVEIGLFDVGGINCPLCKGGIMDLKESDGITLIATDRSDTPFTVIQQICIDSDGGKDYYLKGHTIYNNEYKTDDICYGNYLHESYCKDNSSSQEIYLCPNGCKDGACIAETVKQITKQDVINWVDQNCYDQTISVSTVQNTVSASQSGTKSAAITGNAIKDKIFSNTKEYWRS